MEQLSVIDGNHVARTALRCQRDQRKIFRVLVHRIGEIKHIHIHCCCVRGINRIAIVSGRCGGNAKRLQQKAEQQNFRNGNHERLRAKKVINCNQEALRRASQTTFLRSISWTCFIRQVSALKGGTSNVVQANLSESMAVLEGARAALKVAGAVSKGERVGFICDLRVESDVIHAFFTAAADMIGATPFLCMVERGRGYGPPDEFVETIKTANVLYFSWEMANSLVIKALRQERGIRCVGFPHCRTAALLSDDAVRFPLDVLSALYPKTWDVFRCGKDVDVHITDTKGADFRVTLAKKISRRNLPKTRALRPDRRQ